MAVYLISTLMQMNCYMKILSPTDNTSLQTLLDLYIQYTNATDDVIKKQLAGSMYFPNVFVWLAYKYEAYADTSHAIVTIQDIRDHSFSHDGICGKRWKFLAGELTLKAGVNIDAMALQNPTLTIPDFITLLHTHEYLATDSFRQKWEAHEYYKKDGRVAKWENL